MADLLLEKEKLEKNLFWIEVIKEINDRLDYAKNQCSHSVKAPLEDVRRLQGNVESLELVLVLPDLILKEIYEKEQTG